MQYKILNEQPWQILSNAMTISPSSTGYDLQVSANGKDYTTMFHVNEGVTRQVTNLSSGSYYRMLGNEGEVVVNWVRDCSGGGSGGGSGSGSTYTAGEYISIEQDVISVTGITPDQYLTSADTQDFASQAYVNSAITAATQNFMTEASVTAITSPIQGQLDDVERVTATALTELHDAVVEISGNTPDMSNYYDKDEVDAEITGATQGLATEAYVTAATQNMATHAEVTAATANLMTSAQTQSAITAATQDFITSAYTGFTTTEDFEEFAGQMEAKEEVVASAITELHETKVEGVGVKTIEKISQAGYDDLVSGGTVDSYTFYVITGQTGN